MKTPDELKIEWRNAVEGMTFFGVQLSELSRDELLSVVGYLADQVEQERRLHRSTMGMLAKV